MKRLFLILLLLFGCATAPVDTRLAPVEPEVRQECYNPNEVLFITNVGFEVEYDLNEDTTAIAWLISIEIAEEDCKTSKTNLVAFWDGFEYRMYEVQKIDGKMSEFLFVGRFKNFTQMADWVRITRKAFSND